MKLFVFINLILLITYSSMAQQDPEAKKILDRVSEKTKAYTTIQADFQLTIENRREDNVSKTEGKIIIKGDKYYMESLGSKIYFDGTTLWTFQEEINEVIISSPDPDNEDFVENPAKIFDFYNRDFKYRLNDDIQLDEGWMYSIDLFPNNLQQPYSRFKVLIKKETDELFIITAIGKEGIDYSASLYNTKFNATVSDDSFNFNPKDHKGIEVVDMRF